MSNLLEKMLKLFSNNYEMLYEKADEKRTQEQVRRLAHDDGGKLTWKKKNFFLH